MTERTQHKRSFGPGMIMAWYVQVALRCLLAASLALSPALVNAAVAAITNTAEVTASTPTGTSITSSPSSEVVTTDIAAPAVLFGKVGTLNDDDGNTGVTVGDTISYEITADNTGNVSLTGISVSDPLATPVFDAASDTDSDGELDPDEIWRWTASYPLTLTDITSNGGGDGNIENTATLVSSELPNQTDDETVPLLLAPAITLAKLADASGTNSPGDPISYTVTANNSGNVVLTNVTVNDPLLTPDTQVCATLMPGADCILTGSYTTLPADFLAGSITNNASVTTNEGVGDTTSLNTPLTLGPGITVTKSAVPLTINNPGEIVTYNVLVANSGNVPLAGITVTDPMLTLDCGSGTNVIASLPFGGSQTCSGSYTVQQSDFDAGTTLLNTATAQDDGTYTVSDSDDATVTLVLDPSMSVTKVGVLNDDDGVGGVSAGDTISYTITVDNTGNVALSNVTPTDPLATLTLISGDTNSNSLLDVDEVWQFEGSYALQQSDIDSNGGGDGDIDNTVTVSSTELPDETADTQTPLNINPSMDLVKVGTLNDDDGTPGLSAGDSISYEVRVTNTGNIRLTSVVVNDPLVTLTLSSGDTNSDNRLDVDEVWIYSGTTLITQGDLDTLGGGDGDIDNTATVSTDQLADQPVSHELPISPVSALEIIKTSSAADQLFPTVYEYDYQISVRNTGAVTQTAIRVADDLVGAVAPATLTGSPIVVVTGFAGTGGLNTGYNGSSDIQLLTGDVQLAPGAIGLITITLRIDTGAQSVYSLNTAFTTSNEVTTPIPSDDPTQTPGDTSDVNPTVVDITDTDRDGSPDVDEDPTEDRDGDGDNNAVDYDPTGYFYCQADGRILNGALITVENLATGGRQTGVGTSNGIVIFRDGTNGDYQFHVTQAGNYRLSYVLPTTGIASTTLVTSGALDVSSRAPENPVVIGSGEVGNTGYLADFTAASNEFFTDFEIEAGDPAVFNNNIPLQFCGSPAVTADKSVESGPTLLVSGGHEVTYRLVLEASGDEPVNNVQMLDDVEAVFGAGNFTIDNVVLDSVPLGFTGARDPFFDGSGNTALLTSGSTLQPGERIEILMTITVNVVDGIYDNVLSVTGTSPLDGTPVPPSSDNAEITIINPSEELIVSKTALPGSATIGETVFYTITIQNDGASDVTGMDIVDLIPNGTSYVVNSALVDGTAIEPDIRTATRLNSVHTTILDRHENVAPSGRELVWPGLTIPAGDSMEITLRLVINASASGEEFINLAFVRNPVSGEIISNIAKAKVLLEIEPVFQCSDLIGRVFDDLDRDGYYDKGEPGLPGVRLATPNGLLIVTDKFGRYNIACGAIPDEDIGSNFILKVDPRTLPAGYEVTSENPRVVRLTRGKLTKLNFAAAGLRSVTLNLNNGSFVSGSVKLKRDALQRMGGLLQTLNDEPSNLLIVYEDSVGNSALGRERLRAVKSLVARAWEARSRAYDLNVETRMAR